MSVQELFVKTITDSLQALTQMATLQREQVREMLPIMKDMAQHIKALKDRVEKIESDIAELQSEQRTFDDDTPGEEWKNA